MEREEQLSSRQQQVVFVGVFVPPSFISHPCEQPREQEELSVLPFSHSHRCPRHTFSVLLLTLSLSLSPPDQKPLLLNILFSV